MLGDTLANAGEHTTRHNAVLRAGRLAVEAVAIGAVTCGDKGAPEKTADLNSGHV